MGRESKFNWDGPGQVEMEYSQCRDCTNNKSAIECSVFGVKPDEYADNEKECPEFENEKDSK